MTIAQRRQREALKRRQSILDAARDIFWRKGYARATVAQIAQAAELAPGTLYLYFTGKDALYVELLTEGYELLEQRLKAQLAQESDPRSAAAALIDVLFDFAREHPQYFEIIFFVLQRENAQDWEGNFPAQQVDRLQRWRSACQDAALAVLERANFAPAHRREAIVEALWGMLAGVVFYFSNSDAFDAVAREAKILLLTAVFGTENDTNDIQDHRNG